MRPLYVVCLDSSGATSALRTTVLDSASSSPPIPSFPCFSTRVLMPPLDIHPRSAGVAGLSLVCFVGVLPAPGRSLCAERHRPLPGFRPRTSGPCGTLPLSPDAVLRRIISLPAKKEQGGFVERELPLAALSASVSGAWAGWEVGLHVAVLLGHAWRSTVHPKARESTRKGRRTPQSSDTPSLPML